MDMPMLIKIVATVAVGIVVTTSAFAQGASARDPPGAEHHIAKVGDIRFHYITA